ncbi:hypothetical protein [Acidiphilium sp. C61]|uniref:hypothetical protein n=1 Tax=Acidiphilium sp. C61 TaxID=1671485 RepID=UPI00157A9EB9|nr:hypothetical protein [Acidiphilium sp. C61]
MVSPARLRTPARNHIWPNHPTPHQKRSDPIPKWPLINAVEKTLKPNGLAVHTTEFNLSSNNDTLETGHTVIYRRRDIEELVNHLEKRGHSVESFVIAPDSHPLDFHVDIPPYTHAPHIRLMYEKYIVTSVGLVIKRGRN